MVSLSSLVSSSRSLQIVLSVILIGLTSKLLSNRCSLASASELLSEYNSATNGTNLELSNSWKTEAATLSSALITFISCVINYYYPTTALYFLKNSAQISADSTISDYNFITLSAEEFSKRGPLSVSALHTSILTTLTSSESVSNAFWFVNMIIQISDFASSDCDSISGLLDTYNLTGSSTTSSLSNYFNFNLGNSNTSNIYDEFYSALSSLNLTNLDDLSLTNLNTTILESELLLSLSSDCSVKKSTMALTILIWITHIISSGLLTSEIVSFCNKFSTTKSKVIKKLEQVKQDEENKAEEEENGDEDLNTAVVGDKTVNSDANHNVLLTFSHRWGLFDIKFKDGISETEEE